MTDVAPDMGTDAPSTDAPATDAPPATGDDLTAEVAKWKELARKHEDRAKANAAAAKELEKVRAASMTEQEKAVAEAVAAARQQTLAEVGGRLAAAEVKAAAAGRLDDQQLAVLLDSVDLTKFLTEDGEVDTEKVAAFVDGIAPAKTTTETPVDERKLLFETVDLGQGARGKDLPLNGDPLLNAVRDRLGISR